MLILPEQYANLAEIMYTANLFAEANGLPLAHTADEIADNWRVWVTEGDLIWGTGEVTWLVPSGFMTDFASIPAMFTWLFPPVSAPWQVAAVLHDYLYSSVEGITRKDADRAYYWVARAVGTSEFKAAAMYAGLRLGAFMAWRKNRKRLKNEGNRWRFIAG